MKLADRLPPYLDEETDIVPLLSARNTIGALFKDEHQARMAMRELDQMGFRRVWMGVVRTIDPCSELALVDSEFGGGIFETIGRIFGGDGDRSLHAALTSHGVKELSARALTRRIRAGYAVMTVDAESCLGRVREVIRAYDGEMEPEEPPSNLRNRVHPRSNDIDAVFL